MAPSEYARFCDRYMEIYEKYSPYLIVGANDSESYKKASKNEAIFTRNSIGLSRFYPFEQ